MDIIEVEEPETGVMEEDELVDPEAVMAPLDMVLAAEPPVKEAETALTLGLYVLMPWLLWWCQTLWLFLSI